CLSRLYPDTYDGKRLERSRASSPDHYASSYWTGWCTRRDCGSRRLALLRCGLVCHWAYHDCGRRLCGTIAGLRLLRATLQTLTQHAGKFSPALDMHTSIRDGLR